MTERFNANQLPALDPSAVLDGSPEQAELLRNKVFETQVAATHTWTGLSDAINDHYERGGSINSSQEKYTATALIHYIYTGQHEAVTGSFGLRDKVTELFDELKEEWKNYFKDHIKQLNSREDFDAYLGKLKTDPTFIMEQTIFSELTRALAEFRKNEQQAEATDASISSSGYGEVIKVYERLS